MDSHRGSTRPSQSTAVNGSQRHYNMKKINQVTVLSSFPPVKGITPYTVELVRELEKSAEVQGIGFNAIYPEFLYKRGTKDDSLKMPDLKNTEVQNTITWYSPFSWVKAGRKVQGDILHVQWWSWPLAPIYWVILKVARFRGKKIIMTVHNLVPHEASALKKWMNTSVLHLADKFIVHSQAQAEALQILYPETAVKVIPHGILTGPNSGLTRHAARGELAISPEKKVILFFGNIRPYKGLDNLLRAVHELRKQDSKILLIIAGQCWEDWKKYKKIIDELDLSGCILRIQGFLSEEQVETVFKASDLLVLPYKAFDAQSGVAALSLFYELPLMVSKIAGLTEMTVDESLVFWTGDTVELAEKIRKFFSGKEDYAIRIRELKKEFDWKKIAEETVKFYEL